MVVEEFSLCVCVMHTKMLLHLKTVGSRAKKHSGKWLDKPFPDAGMLFRSQLKRSVCLSTNSGK